MGRSLPGESDDYKKIEFGSRIQLIAPVEDFRQLQFFVRYGVW